jgi:hypothetical protein
MRMFPVFEPSPIVMNEMKKTLPLLFLALAAPFCATAQASSEPVAQAYNWKSVRMGGCGYVSGITFHPAEKGLAYARTDMGGAYRRDSERGEWIPITDWISLEDVNLLGIESIAVDPNDPDRVYMACGTNTGPEAPMGAILRSKDRGRTFEIIRVPYQFGGNENGRGNGERMAVDPRNGDILYLGTRYNGLLRSGDAGSTWQRVTSFPDMTEIPPEEVKSSPPDVWLRWIGGGSGVFRVIFAGDAADKGRTSTIYAAVSHMGQPSVFVTHDAGGSWQPIPGQPTKLRPTDMDLGPDGCLYLSYGTSPTPMGMTDGDVWKFDTKSGVWTDITPARPGMNPGDEHNLFGYGCVAVDPARPGVVMAVPFWYVGGEDIFRSLDGGKTWKPVIRTCANWDYSAIPYSQAPILHWMTDLEVDPANPDHAIFVTGFGGLETFDFTNVDTASTNADGNTWMPMMKGIEESVPLDFFSPETGPTLVTGIGDYGGFIHYDLDKIPEEGAFATPRYANTTGLGYAWERPNIYVRVGTSLKGQGANFAYSTDSGKSWTSGTNISPESHNGSVAIAPDASTCVWTPEDVRKRGDWMVIEKSFVPHYSADMGQTWAECAGLPEGIHVTADTVNPLRFYAFDAFTRKYYTSTDGARTFTSSRISLEGAIPVRSSMRGDARSGRDRLFLAPHREGDVWICLYDGLYRIREDGTFRRLPHVEQSLALGFGKSRTEGGYPALYLVGVVDGVRGIFRSDDEGASYVRINDAAHQWGSLLLITGDMNRYGRVYVGTHGRGAVYGDIATEGTPAR